MKLLKHFVFMSNLCDYWSVDAKCVSYSRPPPPHQESQDRPCSQSAYQEVYFKGKPCAMEGPTELYIVYLYNILQKKMS